MKIKFLISILALMLCINVVSAQTADDDARLRSRINAAVMKVYDDQLEKEPGDYNTRFARANQLFYNGEFAQSLSDIATVLEQAPDKEKDIRYESYLLRARIYDVQENYKDEIEALRTATTISPKSMSAIDMLAKVSYKVGDMDAAEANFMTILRDDALNYDALYGLAKVEAKRSNFEKAAQYADRAVSLYPAEPQVFINRSDVLCMMQQYEPAAQDLISALSVGNETSKALQALVDMSDNHYTEVMDALSNCIDKAPQVGTFYYVRSSIAMRHNHYAQALYELKLIMANNLYDYHSIYGDAATCQMELTQYDDALVNVNKAITMDPENVDYYVLRARIKTAKGNTDAALNDIEKALSLANGYEPALLTRARIFIDKRADNDALKDVDAIINANPQNNEALLLRGWINKYRLRNTVAAQNDFERMLQGTDDMTSLRGFALHELGRDIDARDWAKKIINDNMLPGGQSYFFASALLSDIGDNEMGDKGAAIDYLRSALANGYGSLYELKVNESPYVNLKLVRRYPEFNTIIEQNSTNFDEKR